MFVTQQATRQSAFASFNRQSEADSARESSAGTHATILTSQLDPTNTVSTPSIHSGIMKYLCVLIAFCVLLAGCGKTGPTTSTTTATTSTSTTAAPPTSSTTNATDSQISDACLSNVFAYLTQLRAPLAQTDLDQTVSQIEGTIGGAEMVELSARFHEDNPCSESEMAMLTIPVVRGIVPGDQQTENFFDWVLDNEDELATAGWTLYPICGGLGAVGDLGL